MYVIIVGGGQIGTYLASQLLTAGHRTRILEKKRETVEHIQERFPEGIVSYANGANPTALEAAGIQQADVVAAVTGADETNLVVSTISRFEFNVPRIIARVNNPKNAWLFTPEMGVDVPLNQAELLGQLILEEMSVGDIMTLLKLRRGQYSLVEEKVDPQARAAGRAIRDLDLPPKCILTAVIRKGELVIPRGSTILQPFDEILAICHSSQLEELSQILGS